jgi:phosphate transport system ATP-binding protein
MVTSGNFTPGEEIAVSTHELSIFYNETQALRSVTIAIARNRVTALIGPSGCGKSSFLRALNRLNDRIPGFRMTGQVEVAGIDPYADGVDLIELRRRVGMVFQKPTPLPMSIYDNVAIGPRSHYGLRGSRLDDVVEQSLRQAALWDEVKDILRRPAFQLSGGQQQRLCIARMLAVNPEIILMDEPCSALDPISTFRIEELMVELSQQRTVIVVTHNMQQAARVSDYTAFFMYGELIEYGASKELFLSPKQKATEDYISGRFG